MTTLYKKVGRRYIPVGEEYERVWPHGSYIVVSSPGSVRTTPVKDPGYAEFAIAMIVAKEAMASSMLEMMYSGKPYSINHVVEAGIKALEEESKSRRPVPL